MEPQPRCPSSRSLRALDALNFFLADVRDGLGPFLAIYLTSSLHWDASKVGVALAAMTIGTTVAQTPAGALIDRIRAKRFAVGLGAVIVAIGCVLMIQVPTYPLIITAQAIIGAAAAIFGPAIAALSLGIVGHSLFSSRTGRNEAFNHAGNVVAALLAGAAGYYIGYSSIFYLVAAMAVASGISVLMIREDEIDHELARGSASEGDVPCDAAAPPNPSPVPKEKPALEGVSALLKDPRIVVFIASAVIFHFANAAMLPLVGEKVTHGVDKNLVRSAPALMSACIIVAQLVMVPVAVASSRLADRWGRKPLFLIGFAVLPIRGLLYTMTANSTLLIGVQLLDGIGAGIFGVVSVLVIADITQGTGRFNLTQGALATATGIGASLSNVVTGLIVAQGGFNAGFLTLAAIALAGSAFFAIAMPETKDASTTGVAFDPKIAAVPASS